MLMYFCVSADHVNIECTFQMLIQVLKTIDIIKIFLHLDANFSLFVWPYISQTHYWRSMQARSESERLYHSSRCESSVLTLYQLYIEP